MEHEEVPAALAAGTSSCLDLFDFESGVNGNIYGGGQSIGGPSSGIEKQDCCLHPRSETGI